MKYTTKDDFSNNFLYFFNFLDNKKIISFLDMIIFFNLTKVKLIFKK